MRISPLAPWWIAAFLLGCAGRSGDSFALAAAAIAPDRSPTTIGGPVQGEACPAWSTDALKEAARRALAQAPGANALVDARVTIIEHYWARVLSLELSERSWCARVEGYPAILR